jgi:excinuclease ABC subunit B
VKIQYSRNDVAFDRATFRVRGDTVEILPAYEEQGVRVEMWGDEIERISKIDPLTGEVIANLEKAAIYPAKHFVTSRPTIQRAVELIRAELVERLNELRTTGKLLEAQRLESRTNFDIEMMLEIGTCAGIENYSRHLSGPCRGRKTRVPVRLFPRGFSSRGGRVARHASPGRRNVQRRSRTKAHACRVRVSSSERVGQPPADVR